MSEKFVNRRKNKRMKDATSRYDELERLINDITENLAESKDELDELVDLFASELAKNPTSSLIDLKDEVKDCEADYQLISEDFDVLNNIFGNIKKDKEELNLERSSHQAKLLKRVDDFYEDAEEFLEEVEEFRDEIFELVEEINDKETKGSSKQKQEFKSIEDISGIINEAFAGIRNVFVDLSGKGNGIVSMLPFLGKEEKKELVQMIIDGHEDAKNLKLSSVFPFLDESDCDKIFLAKMKEIPTKEITALFPFVSKEALSVMVDEYLEGNFEGLNMNTVYPFLDQESIKKIFYKELKKNN